MAATTESRVGVPPAAAKVPGVTRVKRAPRTVQWRILGYVVFLGLWQITSTYFIAPHILPSPVTIAQEMAGIIDHGDFVTHFWATMERTLISLPLVFLIGAAIGIAMGLSRWWESFFRDFVTILLSVPGLILVLIFILIMGLNPAGPILAIVVTNFAFVTVQLWEGVKSLPRELTDMAASFGVARSKVIRHVIVPALAPFLFTAFTYAFTLTWKLAMLSELFGGSRGVGFRMRAEFWQFNVAGMLAWALLLFVITLAIERLVLKRLERHVLRWREVTFQ